MSEGNGEKKEEMPVPFIHIELQENGTKISVTSNINQLALGLGLCEVAKDYVKLSIAQRIKESNKVQPVPHGVMDFLRRGKS